MKPTYFPFTYIRSSVLEMVGNCIETVRVYQPTRSPLPGAMKSWADEGRLEVRRVPATDESRIEGLLNDYRHWADLHQGDQLALFKTLGGRIPFFDDSSIRHLNWELKQKMSGRPEKTETDSSGLDLLLQARLFLQIAQEFDQQSDEISQTLDRSERTNAQLIKELQGLTQPPSPAGPPAGKAGRWEPGDRLIFERLRAWTRIWNRDPDPPEVLITDSPSVIEQLLETFPDLTPRFDWYVAKNPPADRQTVRRRQNQLETCLQQEGSAAASSQEPCRAGAEPPESDSESVVLRFYRLSGTEFLEWGLGRNRPENAAADLGGDPPVQVWVTMMAQT